MKKIIYSFTLLAFTLVSCSDYLDVNTTTNNPLSPTVPARLVLPGAQNLAFNAQVGGTRMNQLGSVWTNSWAGDVNRVTGGYSREFTLNIDNTFYNGIWDGIYLSVANFQEIINTDETNQENYIAIAKILKAYYLQYIVDLYGDSPYSQAFQGVANLTPAYDDDRETYRGLIQELEEARELIANSPDADPAESDIMLHGDMDAWVSFANTIELRMLLRQSNLTDAETVTYRDAKLAELAALNDFVTSNVTINPGYSTLNDDQQNIFFNDYVANTASQAPQNRNFVVASGHIATFLNGTQTSPTNTVGLPDPRRTRMFAPIPGGSTIGGVIQGDVTTIGGGTAPVSAQLSRLGIGLTGTQSGPAELGGLVNGSSRDGFVMLAAESYFLQAEAAVRYPAIFATDAHALFNDGITASFDFYTESSTTQAPLDPAAYIAAADSYDKLGWTASTNKIEAIMTQKWLALTGIHGIEPYLDYVRTGFPVTPLALTAQHDAKPKRLYYPLSEYVANSTHIPAGVDVFNLGAFWTE